MQKMNRRLFIEVLAKISAVLFVGSKVFATPIESTDITEETNQPMIPFSENAGPQEVMFSHGFASVASVPLCTHLYKK